MAVVSEELKAIFLANPGTGSTAVEQALHGQYGWLKIGNKHDGYQQLQEKTGYDLDKYFIFTTVRNPFTWFAAEYSRFKNSWSVKMQNDPNHWIHGDPSVKKRIQIAVSGDFDGFLDYYIKHTAAPHGKWRFQYWEKAQYIMMTERLDLDWQNLLRILRMPSTKLPRINEVPSELKIPKDELFTDSQIERINMTYGAYLEVFNYSYD